MEKKDQDYYLSNLMRKKPSKSSQIRWDYFIKLDNLSEIKVCLEFIINLFQISPSRLMTVRNKLKNNINLMDMRGRTSKKPACINKEIFGEFIESIPKAPSHYGKSQKLFFSNTNLDYTKLFSEYKNFLINKSFNQNLCINSFKSYFKKNCNISIKKLITDYCDLCFKNERKVENLQLLDKENFIRHQTNRGLHKNLKNFYLDDEKYIVIEFDYAQNRPLPKLPNCALFYRRLLWLFVFNVHIHNYKSFIFYSLEGKTPKNSNSVCSNLYQVIEILKSENKLVNKEIIFLSDNTCSQNKNWNMVKFCSFLSIILV